MEIKAIVSDIEGTTTPISFVKDVLFPYSYEKIEEFLKQNWDKPDIQQIVKQVQEIQKSEYSFEQIVEILKNG